MAALSADGKPITLKLDGWLARVFLHEYRPPPIRSRLLFAAPAVLRGACMRGSGLRATLFCTRADRIRFDHLNGVLYIDHLSEECRQRVRGTGPALASCAYAAVHSLAGSLCSREAGQGAP